MLPDRGVCSLWLVPAGEVIGRPGPAAASAPGRVRPAFSAVFACRALPGALRTEEIGPDALYKWGIASLRTIYHRRLRVTVASLWLVGVGFAGFTAPRAWHRTGVVSALPFLAVTVALLVVAAGVLRGQRTALVVSTAALGGQILGVIGSAWQLAHGVHGSKAHELRDLGVDPELGVALNLAYSALASLVFAWIVARWWAGRRRPTT